MPFRKSNQPFSVVEMTSRSWESLNAWLPTKWMPLTLVAGALVDLEHEVHAVLLELDDLGIDGCRVTALALVDVEDALDVRLHAGAREHRARLQLHLVAQGIGIDLAVTLERDLVDHRILDDGDHHIGAAAVDAHVGEEAGGKQRLDGAVDLARIVGVARRELEVGADGLRLDAPVAVHIDRPDRVRRSRCGLRGQSGRGEQHPR